MSKSKHYETKIDKVGRILIPVKIRRILQAESGKTVDILLEYGEIVIRKYEKPMLNKRVVGIIRKVDSLGRISIPSEIVRELEITPQDTIIITPNIKKQKMNLFIKRN